MKKRFALFCVFVLVCVAFIGLLTFSSSANTNTYTNGDYIYTVSNGEATITDVNSPLSGGITIPSTLGGYPVTRIDSFDCNLVTRIQIPDSVKTIGAFAFSRCASLESIDIPNSVTSIGFSAFEGCKSLWHITIPESVTSIGMSAFKNCTNLSSATFAENSLLTNIEASAFHGCTKLASIVLPNSTTVIGDSAFRGCTKLASIMLPSSITVIGDLAFQGCTNLSSVTFDENGLLTNIGAGAFQDCTGLTSVTIPKSVSSIGRSAFYRCTRLERITLPFVGATKDGTENTHFGYIFGDTGSIPVSLKTVVITSVTNIASSAFSGCTGLASITLPDSVTSIGDYVFYNCTGLTSITIPDSVTSIGGCAFCNCTGLTSVNIGNGVTNIGSGAFSNCTGLTSITVSESVSSIGASAFFGCTSLTSIIIPDRVTNIGKDAFSNCRGLTAVHISDLAPWCEISFADDESNPLFYAKKLYLNGTLVTDLEIPEGVTSIGSYAFRGCASLTSITIPNSVTSIGNYAFYGCTSLTSIAVSSGNTKYYSVRNCLIEKASKNLILGCNNSVIPDGVMSIGTHAFRDCTGLTAVTIPDSVTSIGNYAFRDCTSLASITIPDSVTSIGNYAFYGCTSLTAVHITDLAAWCEISFVEFSSNPLYYAKNLCLNGTLVTDLVIPGSVTSIGNHAFRDCTSLTSITIPNSVTSIGSYAFRDCASLTSITIPDSVSSVGFAAFSGCSALKSITLPFAGATKNGTSNTHFGYIFGASTYSSNGTSVPATLKSVVITGGTSVAFCAFRDCTGLTSITIPDSVTSIGSSAFSGCTSLVSITIPDSVTRIGGSAFRYCSNLKSVTIPDSVISIGESTFQYCDLLTSINIGVGVKSIDSHAFSGCTSIKTVCYKGLKSSWNAINFSNETADPTYYGAKLICLKVIYTFFAEDGTTVLKTETADYGTVITAPTAPTKPATPKYTYIFAGFEGFTEGMTLTEDVTFKAKYNATVNKYTYTFYDEDGVTVLDTATVDYGTKIVAPQNPVKQGTAQYSYPFLGFEGFVDGMTLVEDISFTAKFDTVINQYTYTFYDEDGVTVLKTATVEYGTVVVAPKVDTVVDKMYTYTPYFLRFSEGMTATKNLSFTLAYAQALNKYTYTFFDEDGVSVLHTATADYGTVIVAPTDPTKPATQEYSYPFAGFDGFTAGMTLTDNITFTATYVKTPIYTYTVSAGEVTITGLNASISGDVTIPSTLGGYPVTSIGDNAFRNRAGLTSITIPDSVSSIGNYAFTGCTSITSVTLGNGVTSIGNGAFTGCSITTLKIPDSVKSIGNSAFQDCLRLTSVTLGNGVTSIGNSAFSRCVKLTSIAIPSGVTHISNYSFDYCMSLTSVNIPNSVVSIGSFAFRGCESLTSVDIPDSVISIGLGAFNHCYLLASIKIPSSVVSIGDSAFGLCSALSSVTIEDGVVSIGKNAFYNTAYYNTESNWENGVLYAGNYLLASKDTLCGAYDVKEGTTSIAGSAFHGRSALTSITIPKSVTHIASSAFLDCYNLKTVTYQGTKAEWFEITVEDEFSIPTYYGAKFIRLGDVLALENTAFHTAWGFEFVTSVTATQTAGTGGEFTLILDPLAATLVSFEAAEGVNVVQTGNTLTVTVDRTVEAGETLVTLTMTASDFLPVGETAFLSLEEGGAHTATFAPIVIFNMGDVNMDGAVDTVDAFLVQKHYVGLGELSEVALAYADTRVDGTVDTLDAFCIQKKFVGMDVALGDRHEVNFVSDTEEKKFTVRDGEDLTVIPEAPADYAWSESENEYVAPDFEAIVTDKKYYLVKEDEA